MSIFTSIDIEEKDMEDGSYVYDIILAQELNGGPIGDWHEELGLFPKTVEDAIECVDKIRAAVKEHCWEDLSTNADVFIPSA